MARGFRFCRAYLHVARVKKTHGHARIARETVKKHTYMRESHAKQVRFSHVRVFSDSRNMTQIIYLGPLGSGPRYMICVTLFCTLCEAVTRGI